MEAIKIEITKWEQLSELKQGDKVKLTNGETAEFVRLKRKNFIGKIDGELYDIPVSLFDKVLEIVDDLRPEIINTLKKGDFFIIDTGNGSPLVYKFDSFNKNKIVGINPISNGKALIDKETFVNKLENL